MGIATHDLKREGVDRELLARVQALGAALRPTPVVRLPHPRCNLFAKLEYHSVVGSLKDRPAYRNPSAMAAHYELTAGEILASSSALDYVFVGVSTAGTIAGVSRRLKAHFPDVKVVAVEAPDFFWELTR